MKRIFKKFVECLYFKTFPERKRHIPIPDLIKVNMETYSPNILEARKIYYPFEVPYINEGVVYEEMLKILTPELVKYIDLIKIEGGYPITNDPNYVTYEAKLMVLKKEAIQ